MPTRPVSRPWCRRHCRPRRTNCCSIHMHRLPA